MSSSPGRAPEYVVDASAGIKLVVDEEHSQRARELFDLMANDPPAIVHVPDLFFFECANVLWKHVRRGDTPVELALHGMHGLLALPLVVHPAASLAARALELGVAYDISAYDASYVALAHMRGLPLVTADERLGRKVADAPVRIAWLGEWTPESR